MKRSLVRDWVDEAEIIASLAATRPAPPGSVLVDVGAHYGAVTTLFLEMGWSVVAYEPDPSNRDQFQRRINAHPRVQLSASAVSDKSAEAVSLFTSSVSTGFSTLAASHESREPTAVVDVGTLAEGLRARHVQQVDFLKVDIEGFDFFALKGFDRAYAPRFVLYQFENRKTVPLGYSLADSSAFVADRGYHLVYSVWEPIIEYGTRHRWRGLFSTPPTDARDVLGKRAVLSGEGRRGVVMQRFGPRSHWLFDRRRRGRRVRGVDSMIRYSLPLRKRVLWALRRWFNVALDLFRAPIRRPEVSLVTGNASPAKVLEVEARLRFLFTHIENALEIRRARRASPLTYVRATAVVAVDAAAVSAFACRHVRWVVDLDYDTQSCATDGP